MDILVALNRIAGLVMGVLLIYACLRILDELREGEMAMSMIFLRSRSSVLVFVFFFFIASVFTVLVGLSFITGQKESVVESFLNLNAFFLLAGLMLLSSVMGVPGR
ncbi:putative protein {ECO:0000313/EMBL:ADL58477,1} [Methanothermobacter wolfeii]|uniref:hypothetical protein n=1 Tax=Methanothermobacter wolfeii TaxID=145261 RepID=UPI00092DA950|nr:hypothetical protein [Methanothermobacter wolfeii]SCM57079.1 putative protein {ECO:0000313/EMBL:ADL58477,1} [Methanothermobacter wolfeii]